MARLDGGVGSAAWSTGKIDKLFDTSLRADPGERAVVAMISTTSVDRDGDVLLPSGIDLTNFKKLPTVLLMHKQERLPVGRVPPGGIRQVPDGVQAKAVMEPRPPSLPGNIEWVPDTLLDMFRQGAPLGFSVGFRIKDARVATKRDKDRFGEVKRIISEWELIEFSVVPVPSNADALVQAVSKCARVGSYVRAALGIPQPSTATVTVRPALPRRLRLTMDDGPRRLSV